jgi:probable O-glycosylation ligase (exosortase A-associated)
MRDILLALFILAMVPVMLRRPAIGALMWAWISMMNPHSLTFGFARNVPWAMIIAIITVIGLVSGKHRKGLPINGGTVLIGALLLWMTITTAFALNPDTGDVIDRWVFSAKILFMLIVTIVLLRGRKEIEWLLWVMVVSVGFYGVKGGAWTLLTGGGGRVWGPPGGTLSGNNELAVGLVILLPWVYYLRAVATNAWMRMALLATMLLLALGILGSQSRGALLALGAMAMVLGVKGKQLFKTTLALALVGAALVAFMPDSWAVRMDTIKNYEADTSALSRLWTWKTMWAVAEDRPFLGAGFRADNLYVFHRYAPFEGFETFRGSVYVAHSIYFQALGEHGFVGLALYLGLGIWTWFSAGKLAKSTQNDPEFQTWVPLLMRMTQVSLMGFAVGGAFLSLMLLDLTFYIPAIVILTSATVEQHRKTLEEKMSLGAGSPLFQRVGKRASQRHRSA